MSKRAFQDGDEEMEMDAKAQFGHRRIADDEDVEMGEFEDPWEDELEEDEEIIEGEEDEEEAEDSDEGMVLLGTILTGRNEGRNGRARGVSALQKSRKGSYFNA